MFNNVGNQDMVGNGQRFLFDALVWTLVIAFLSGGKITKGTSMDVFNQSPSRETYFPDYELYHNLSRLNECIYHLVARYPSILDVEMRFRSRWGLSQYVLHFANLSSAAIKSDTGRVKMLLSFGEHSSELLPVESMIYLLENLTAGFDKPEGSYGYNFTMFILNNIDLFIIGMFNPDGRTIIEKTENYCWKETGSGADLNYHSQYTDVSTGRQMIIEPECKVLRELTRLINFDVAVSFHSGYEEILLPRKGNKSSKYNYPGDGELLVLASILSTSSQNKLNYKFVDQLQLHYGDSIFSFIVKTQKIPFSYVVSLWKNKQYTSKNQQCFVKANPKSHRLKEILKSLHPIYTNLFKHTVRWKKSKKISKAKEIKVSHWYVVLPSSFHHIIMYLVLVIFIVLFMIRVNLPLSWKLFYRRQRRVVSLRSLSSAFSLFVI